MKIITWKISEYMTHPPFSKTWSRMNERMKRRENVWNAFICNLWLEWWCMGYGRYEEKETFIDTMRERKKCGNFSAFAEDPNQIWIKFFPLFFLHISLSLSVTQTHTYTHTHTHQIPQHFLQKRKEERKTTQMKIPSFVTMMLIALPTDKVIINVNN